MNLRGRRLRSVRGDRESGEHGRARVRILDNGGHDR